MTPELVNYIGYAASFFVVLSFTLKSVNQIRVLNLIGCVLFVVYGFLNATTLWPVIIPNGLLSLIQVYHLLKGEKKLA